LSQTFSSYYSFTTSSNINFDPVMPIVLLARMDLALISFRDPTTNLYRLKLKALPMFVLWNPYATTIKTSQSAIYNYNINYFNVNNNNKLTLTVNDGNSTQTILPFDGSSGGAGNATATPAIEPTSGSSLGQGSINWLVSGNDTMTMAPGEIRAFGMNGTTSVPAVNLSSANATTSTMKAWLITPLLVSNDQNVSVDNGQEIELPWAGTANDQAIVTASLASTSLRANTAYFSVATPGGLTAWPDSNNTANNRVHPLTPTPLTPTGTWPANVQIASLTGSGYLLVGFSERAKGINAPASSHYYNGDVRIPPFLGNNQVFSDFVGGYWKEVYAKLLQVYASTAEVQLDNDGGATAWHASWGNYSAGDAAVTPQNQRMVLFDVPYQPMMSLGQFAHMGSRYYGGFYDYLPFPPNSVGGSFASSDLPVGQNTYLRGSIGSTTVDFAMDSSFMANQVLFDRYFFSTVPPARVPPADVAKYLMASADLDQAILGNATVTLPNKRMGIYYKNGHPASGSSELTNIRTDLRNTQKAASRLMLEGAFNVNSTSVNAWVALLSSLSGSDLKMWNLTTNSPFTFSASNLSNPIPHFWSVTLGGNSNAMWEGLRDLSDAEVLTLAQNIVAEVKSRGPFLSMGDFLNRRLGSKSLAPLTTMGALQAAIENSNLNASFHGVATTPSLSTLSPGDPYGTDQYARPTSKYFFDGTSGQLTTANAFLADWTATGIPGYLMQQDLVQAFAPVMTVRSDTFLVRVYGEVRNPKTHEIEGKAWGEAVLQRTPDYLDQSDAGLTGTNSYGTGLGDATPPLDQTASPATQLLQSNINKVFGRRFKITSFRWLNENEI